MSLHRSKLATSLIFILTVAPGFAAKRHTQHAPFTFHSSGNGIKSTLLPTLYRSSHAANLIVLKNGDVLCFWFSGTWEGQSDVGIVSSRLPKGSQTWQKTVLIDRKRGRSFQNPVPFQAPDGKLWLFHTSQAAGKGQANAKVLELSSDDNGHTWSKPKPLFTQPGSFTRQPLVITSDGRWLLPMYVTPSAGIVKGAASNYPIVQVSKDSGKTWHECRIPDSNGLVQPNIIKLKAHSYIAFFRSRFADWIYKSTSSNGCTWSPPVPTSLPNNNSSIQAVRLKNGDLVMAFNNSRGPMGKRKPQTARRWPLSVALSKDNGKTWSYVRDIERGYGREQRSEGLPKEKDLGREAFSYPSIVQLPNGNILVAYTYRREAIKVVEFPETWIEHGSTDGFYKPPTGSSHRVSQK